MIYSYNRDSDLYAPQAQSEVAALQLQLAAYEKDREELLRVRRQATTAERKLKALEWDHDVCVQDSVRVQPNVCNIRWQRPSSA